MTGIVQFIELRMEAGQRGKHGREHCHGRRGAREPREVMFHVLVKIGMAGELGAELRVFGCRGQPAEHQQPGNLDEVGVLFETFQRDAAVAQNAFLPVDIGDGAFAAVV